MPNKTLKDIRCRCGHDKAQHQPLDAQGMEWCNGCGCSMFEPLHEPDPPYAPTLAGPLPTWIAGIVNTNAAITSFIDAISGRNA